MNPPVEIDVRAGGGASDYPVLIAAGLRHDLGAEVARRVPEVGRWAVVTDANVGPLYAEEVERGLEKAGLSGPRVTVPPGETGKTRDTWARVTDRLLEAGLGRDGGVIALGGGVVGDLAGFVAATFMRGIPVVQVPTSLLAMVDASVGGKTGVDTPHGKNLVGAFHPPRIVIVDPDVIASLPTPDRRQGLAEALKHGAILDREYGEWIVSRADALLEGESEAVRRLVRRSVEIKADVVSRDEREGGLREILNFGHTVAHALEHVSGYRLAHGSAVALGMVAEAALGEARGLTASGTADELAGWLGSVGLPTGLDEIDGGWAAPGAEGFEGRFDEGILRDKKVRGGSPRVVLLERCGAVARGPDGSWAREVPLRAILPHVDAARH